MLRAAMAAVLAAAVLFGMPPRAQAAQVATLRVMLSPAAAPRGTLPEVMRDRLERLTGARLTLIATTRTGALDLAADALHDASELKAALTALRRDRAVLWAEIPPTADRLRMARAKAATPLINSRETGRGSGTQRGAGTGSSRAGTMGGSAGRIISFSHKAQARSMAFSNSRTFPG